MISDLLLKIPQIPTLLNMLALLKMLDTLPLLSSLPEEFLFILKILDQLLPLGSLFSESGVLPMYLCNIMSLLSYENG